MTTTPTPDLIALDDAETAQLVAEVLTARQAHALYPSGLTHAITRDRLQGAEQRLTGHLAAHGVKDVRTYALELERVASLDDAEDQADEGTGYGTHGAERCPDCGQHTSDPAPDDCAETSAHDDQAAGVTR